MKTSNIIIELTDPAYKTFNDCKSRSNQNSVKPTWSMHSNITFRLIELAPYRSHITKAYQKDKPDDERSIWILTTSPWSEPSDLL